MSKAILILEKHEHCIDCRLLDREYGTCVVTGGYVERMIRKEDRREIPCPLKPMPSHKDIIPKDEYFDEQDHIDDLIDMSFNEGYNKCIDEILGEKNNETD